MILTIPHPHPPPAEPWCAFCRHGCHGCSSQKEPFLAGCEFAFAGLGAFAGKEAAADSQKPQHGCARGDCSVCCDTCVCAVTLVCVCCDTCVCVRLVCVCCILLTYSHISVRCCYCCGVYVCVCLLLLLLWCVCICGVACHVVDLGLSHLAVAKLFQETVSRDWFQEIVFKVPFLSSKIHSLEKGLCRLVVVWSLPCPTLWLRAFAGFSAQSCFKRLFLKLTIWALSRLGFWASAKQASNTLLWSSPFGKLTFTKQYGLDSEPSLAWM